MLNGLIKFWKSIICSSIILLLSFIPGRSFKDVSVPEYTDLVVHAVMYFSLGMALLLDFRVLNSRTSLFKNAVVFVIAIFIGAITEIIQGCCIVNRDGNIYDFIFNTIGVCIALFLGWIFRIK